MRFTPIGVYQTGEVVQDVARWNAEVPNSTMHPAAGVHPRHVEEIGVTRMFEWFRVVAAAACCAIVGVVVAMTTTLDAAAQTPNVRIYVQGDQRCVESNGVPNHAMGQFPNSGNPNRFRAQSLRLCFDANPRKQATPTRGTPNVGVALNGIVMRPGTADWYDASSARGFSRDPASGWNLEGMGSAADLGIDQSNAHVDHRGLYHYHGVPSGLVGQLDDTLIGYAADGFEIHYVGGKAIPSYVLKLGSRRTAPGGKHDGRFVQDWEYKPGHGNLDECNGGQLNGEFVYFATDTYPFFPRCHWGRVSASFQQRGRPERGADRRSRRRGGPLADAAAALGVDEHRLARAIGRPPNQFARAARKLGIPESKIRDVLRRYPPR